MWKYILRRLAYMIGLLVLVSVVSFVVIQLPPGDYLTMYIRSLEASGQKVDQSEIDAMKRQYGLDLPMHKQYLKWVGGMARGDFGRSLQWNRPVKELIGERLTLTIALNAAALVFTYVFAIAIGVYSATRQYSIGDYAFTVLGFVGMSIPSFLFALILMVVFNNVFGLSVGGLFSPDYVDAPWSWGRVADLLKHLPLPAVIMGTAGAAGLIRVMRGSLLDELNKQYVVTARTKGLSEMKLLFKYPMRVAVNPVISTIGWILPGLVSGGAIVAVVLNLPTVGPLLLNALLAQDMYLAGTLLLFLCCLTLIGTFISDLLLAWLDPRVQFGGGGQR